MFYLLFKNAYSKFLFQTLNVDFQRGQYINYNQRKQREKRQFLSTGVQNLSELRRSVNTTGGRSGVTSVEAADPDAFEEQLGEMAGVLPIRDPLSTVTTATGVTVRAYTAQQSSERVDDDELPDIPETVNLEQLPQLQAPPAPMPSQGLTREDRRPPPVQNTGGARQRQAAPVRRSVESVPVRRRVNRETPQEQ